MINDLTTYRKSVVLPKMGDKSEATKKYPVIELERAHIVDDQLIFDSVEKFDHVLRQGFFLVKIPKNVDTTPGDIFAREFHQSKYGDDEMDSFRGYRNLEVPGDYQGYFDREHDQWENFYIEKSNWDLLPPSVVILGQQMTKIGIIILRSVLQYLNLPQQDWPIVSGGLSDNQGHQMLAFNHFRSEKNIRGCKFHRDSGWVTVLRSTEPGLLAFIDDRLWAINPVPEYFIVNFGSSIEVLTENLPKPVRANIHGVVRTHANPKKPNRTSYVTFLDSSLDGAIYQYRNGTPEAIQSVADFAIQEVTRTYDDSHAL